MTQQFYILSRSSWEDYEPHFFIGPPNANHSQSEFRAICDNLLKAAGSRALVEFKSDYIGWSEIVHCMITLLEMFGFVHIEPTKCNYFGPGIIHDKSEFMVGNDDDKFGDVAERILAHNLDIRDEGFTD